MRLNDRASHGELRRKCNFPKERYRPFLIYSIRILSIEWDRERLSGSLLYLCLGPSSSRAEGPKSPVQCQCEAFCNPGLGPSAPDWTTSLQSKTPPRILLEDTLSKLLAASANSCTYCVLGSQTALRCPSCLVLSLCGSWWNSPRWHRSRALWCSPSQATAQWLCKSLHPSLPWSQNKTDFSEQLDPQSSSNCQTTVTTKPFCSGAETCLWYGNAHDSLNMLSCTWH